MGKGEMAHRSNLGGRLHVTLDASRSVPARRVAVRRRSRCSRRSRNRRPRHWRPPPRPPGQWAPPRWRRGRGASPARHGTTCMARRESPGSTPRAGSTDTPCTGRVHDAAALVAGCFDEPRGRLARDATADAAASRPARSHVAMIGSAPRSRRQTEHDAPRRDRPVTAPARGRIRRRPGLWRAAPHVEARDRPRARPRDVGGSERHADVVEALIEIGPDFPHAPSTPFTPRLFAVVDGHSTSFAPCWARCAGGQRAPVAPASPRRPQSAPAGLSGWDHARARSVTNAALGVAAALLDARGDPNAMDRPPPCCTDRRCASQAAGHRPSALRLGLCRASFVRKPGARAERKSRPDDGAAQTNNTEPRGPAHPVHAGRARRHAELMRTLAELGADPLARTRIQYRASCRRGLAPASGEDAGTETKS